MMINKYFFRRVIPEQEINATERDQFWQKEEMEEKKRLEQERLRQEKERQKIEQEIRAREEKETQLREQKVCCNRLSESYQITRATFVKILFSSGNRQGKFNRAAEVGRTACGRRKQLAQSVSRSKF